MSCCPFRPSCGGDVVTISGLLPCVRWFGLASATAAATTEGHEAPVWGCIGFAETVRAYDEVRDSFPRPTRRQQKREADSHRQTYLMRSKHPPQNTLSLSSDDGITHRVRSWLTAES